MTTVKTDLIPATQAVAIPFAPSASIDQTDVQRAIEDVSAASAPVGAQYVVAASDATLTAERVLTDTATVSWDTATAGQMKANIADAELLAIAALATTDGNVIVGNGTTWVAESGDTARTSLGVGTGDSPQFAGVNIGHASDTTLTRVSAGDIAVEGNTVYRAGGTDVPVTDGGTGASTAAGAASNLGLGTEDSPQFTGIELGHATDTTLTRVSAGVVAVEGSNVLLASGLGSITQAYDADLSAVAGLSATGLIARTGSGTATARTITATTNGGLAVTNGDGVSGNPTLALGNYLPSGTGAVARTVTGKLGEMISVTDFGAVPDGSTDSTSAFNAAIAAAYSYKADIYLPAGSSPYVISPITLGGSSGQMCRFIGQNYDPSGYAYPGTSILLKSGSSGSMFYINTTSGSNPCPPHIFERIGFLGNKDNVAAAYSAIMQLQSDATSTYKFGVIVRDCWFDGARDDFVYIDRNRNSMLQNVKMYNNGHTSGSGSAIYINTFDCVLENVNIGNSYGYGLYLADNIQQLQIRNLQSYYNKYCGVYVSSGCIEIQWNGGSVDRNEQYGILINKTSNTTYPGGLRSISNVRFSNNGNTVDATYPDIQVQDDDTSTVFTNCYFVGSGDYPSYRATYPIVFNNASASIRAIGCNFAASKYSSSSVTNEPTCLVQTACSTY